MFSEILHILLLNFIVFGTHAAPVNNVTGCPNGQSRFSVQDVKAEIDRIYDEVYSEMVEDAYVPRAKHMASRLLMAVENLRQSVENHPRHLVHVLEGVSNISKLVIEPVAKHIAEELKQNPELKGKLEDEVTETRQSLFTLNKYEALCAINDCANKTEVEVVQLSGSEPQDDDDYYCSTLENLRVDISHKLAKVVQVIVRNINNQLDNMELNHTIRFDLLVHKINAALPAKLANTMYDMLQLEDAYVHLHNHISNVPIDSDMFTLKQLLHDIEPKLFTLNHSVEVYGNYCRHCHDKLVRQTRSVSGRDQRMLDRLIEETRKLVTEQAALEIGLAMHVAENLLRKTEDVPKYLKVLDPLLKRVETLTAKQRAVLEDLKAMVPKESVREVMDMILESNELLQVVEKKINILKPYQ